MNDRVFDSSRRSVFLKTLKGTPKRLVLGEVFAEFVSTRHFDVVVTRDAKPVEFNDEPG